MRRRSIGLLRIADGMLRLSLRRPDVAADQPDGEGRGQSLERSKPGHHMVSHSQKISLF